MNDDESFGDVFRGIVSFNLTFFLVFPWKKNEKLQDENSIHQKTSPVNVDTLSPEDV